MQAEAIFWLIATLAMLFIEGATAGLVIIWFAIGSLAALICALLGGQIWLQILLFALVSGAALVATLASYFPALDLLKDMNQKSRFLVLTFSISATFVLGDHLGFIAGVDPEMVVPMMVSKMVAGITALLLANVLAPKLLK